MIMAMILGASLAVNGLLLYREGKRAYWKKQYAKKKQQGRKPRKDWRK